MSAREQLIEDIQLLPEHTLQAIGIIVKDILMYKPEKREDEFENIRKRRTAAFGCLKGKIRVPDDFNEPLDDFEEYM